MQKSQPSPPSKFSADVSPWVILGAVVVLCALFGYMTAENLSRQKDNNVRLLLEKGAALIRSFEAGTRLGMRRSEFRLQRLLSETAQQPDIDYLLITDAAGVILHHSDQSRIGETHGQELNLAAVEQSADIFWRISEQGDAAKTFEVYRKFTPTSVVKRRRHRPQMPHPPMTAHGMHGDTPPPAVIFVGLDMRTIEAARRADTRQILISGTLLLLAAVAGILLLFLAQSYRAARASLTRIQAFSDTLVANMPMGLVAVDAQAKLSYLNPVAQSILDLPPQAHIGQPAQRRLDPALWDLMMSKAASHGIAEAEVDFQRRDGEVTPLAVSATTLKAQGDAPWGRILLLKDLSDLKALRKEVARNQRLASLGSLAAGVAHEVRNPLSSIKGFATFFREKYGRRAEDRQVADIMIQEVDRLNRVVSQLLEFARPISIQKKKVSAKGLIEGTLKLIAHQATDRQIDIQTHVVPEELRVSVDYDRFNQVLLNLFLNAVESMEPGGQLSIEVSRVNNGKQTEFRIEDSGCGLQSEDLTKIFDPYYTTKSAGTGLGLAIVHNIVEAHGGDIHVTSQLQKGTTILIRVPHQETMDV